MACGGGTQSAAPVPDPVVDAGRDALADVVEVDTDEPEEVGEDVEGDVPERPMTPDFLGEDAGDEVEGVLQVLTYNVAGLPQGVSSSDPVRNIPQISPKLNAYDLAMVQEDFWYHTELKAEVDHPYLTVSWRETDPLSDNIGDGLNRFSRKPFGAFERVDWGACHGRFECANDCLATKGFSYGVMALANGVKVDVYNLHAEAGGCDEDYIAREAGIEKLIDFAQARSEGRAILMMGDFNLHVVRDEADGVLFGHLLDALGLRDACWEVDCGDERIDRILMRDAEGLSLRTLSWEVPPEFVTASGEDLSDHKPVAIELGWSVVVD